METERIEHLECLARLLRDHARALDARELHRGADAVRAAADALDRDARALAGPKGGAT